MQSHRVVRHLDTRPPSNAQPSPVIGHMLARKSIYRRSLRHASADRLPASPRRLLKNSLLNGTLTAGC